MSADKAEAALERVLRAALKGLQLDGSVSVRPREDGALVGTIEGDGLEALVGRDGETIDALQYLANQAVSRAAGERRQVVVDAMGYRGRREQELGRLALLAADEAVKHSEEIELDPMTAHDRRIVHMALAERADVVTRSEGEEPRRRIVVLPAD